jgi:hypothetical protein
MEISAGENSKKTKPIQSQFQDPTAVNSGVSVCFEPGQRENLL